MKIDAVLSWYSMSDAAARVKKGFFARFVASLLFFRRKEVMGT
jgi:hypothetical protein